MKRILAALAVLVALGVAMRFLPLAEWLAAMQENLRGAGAWGMLAFVAAYVVAAVAMIPGSILTLFAGMVYGLGWGVALVVPASVLGATAAAWLGRTLLRSQVEKMTRGHPGWAAIDEAVSREGLKIVVLTRLSPIFPFNFLNYAFGVSGVPMGRYVLGSAVGMFPGTLAYVYLGTLIPSVARLVDEGAPESGSWVSTALYIAGGVATLVLAVVAARLARRALRGAAGADALEAEEEAP
ncbi:MAG: TVP38/TMEM64 family protein [Myxococcota bacterium]